MTSHKLCLHLVAAYKSPDLQDRTIAVFRDRAERTDKVLKAGKGIGDAAWVGCYAPDRFLPAAREWQGYIRGGHSHISLERMRELRGRLGGTSRWLCAHQRESFKDVVGLIIPYPMRGSVVDWAWQRVKNLEPQFLTGSRRM